LGYPLESFAYGSARSTIEAKHLFIQITLQIRSVKTALKGSTKKPFDQGDHQMNPPRHSFYLPPGMIEGLDADSLIDPNLDNLSSRR